jgi:5-formyltetrahydrofolate cyclo-ligase
LPEYGRAEVVSFYVSVRDEVRTHAGIATALADGKRVAVPYCVADELELFWLRDVAELVPGRFGIPEPLAELRTRDDRRVPAAACDLIFVPGVAFDARGGRIGHGRGFYDRLLARARPDTLRVALGFECQLVDAIPLEPHDVRMHRVVTERSVYVVKD